MSVEQIIPVASPVLNGNEKAYVLDCLDSTWISSKGKYIDRFESSFADFCNVRYAISCCNGTSALHLALMALGVGPGDEVLVPTLTFVATANAVTYCGAKPIFVDSEPETWNIDPSLIESKINPHTKGIIVVHLYGHPADMDTIMAIAHRHNLFVIEDAAEAHGAEYKGQKVGGIGDVGAFSFFGNKIITTGEGGMVTTNDDYLAAKVRQLRGQGLDTKYRYWFPIIGYNYRMTNIAAAIGLAQLEKADWHLDKHREVAEWYKEELSTIRGLTYQQECAWAKHAHWMFSVTLDRDMPFTPNELASHLAHRGIETRPIFYPLHLLPPYQMPVEECNYPVAEYIWQHSITLPTWAGLTRDDVAYICQSFRSYMASNYVKIPTRGVERVLIK